jgi:hypothetical protein
MTYVVTFPSILPIIFHVLTRQALRPGRTAPLQRPNGSNYSVKKPFLYRSSQGRSIMLALLLETTTTEAYPLPPRPRSISKQSPFHTQETLSCVHLMVLYR